MSALLRIALAIVLFSAATAAAQDALTTARDLYASAEYEEALTALGKVTAETSSTVTEIDRYRVLCLMALGRASEADKVIESIVSNDPFYQPAAADAAPRVRAAFTSVRQRMLPVLARSLYLDAKAAFDRKAYAEAASALEKVVKVIDNIEGAGRAELGDLRVLASGFLDLSRASVAAVAAAPAPSPPTEKPASTTVPTPAAALSFTNLVVLKQDLPPLPFSLVSLNAGEYRGMVEVDIDETGSVTDARILQSVHVLYDPLLLKEARDWKYEPPRVGGKPTATVKRVEIVLRPRKGLSR
jgi:TonB family protein